jgi:hypothetical protein
LRAGQRQSLRANRRIVIGGSKIHANQGVESLMRSLTRFRPNSMVRAIFEGRLRRISHFFERAHEHT